MKAPKRFASLSGCALLLLGGCTSGGGEPLPTASGTSRCEITGIESGTSNPGDTEFTFVTVRPGGAPRERRVIVDEPFQPSLTWTGQNGPDTLAAVTALAALPDAPDLVVRDDQSRVAEFLDSIPMTRDAVLGYAAVVPQNVPLIAECEDGLVVAGHLRTWADPDLGVIACGRKPDAEAPAAAVMAYSEFCDR